MQQSIKNALLLILSLVTSMPVLMAQTSHDLALFEAKGPVKSITLTSDPSNFILSPIEGVTYFRANNNSLTYDFDRNGKLTFWVEPTRNADGYITSFDKGIANLNYTYTNGRVSEMDCQLKNNSMEATFTYSAKGNLIKAIESVTGERIVPLKGAYSNYVFDKHGNWIKRTLTISLNTVDGSSSPSNTVTQTRTITYY